MPRRRRAAFGATAVFWKTRNHRPLTLRPEVLIAGAALLLSATTVLAGAWFALRGSVVTAVPPDSVFFYRDAGKGAVLTAGVDTSLVNSASGNYGDVVTRVTMEIETPKGDGPIFFYSTLVTPVFSETAERQASECPVTARCVRADQFLAIEQPRRTLDVPGGASRSEYIGFVLHSTNCVEKGRCNSFQDLVSAAAELERNQNLKVVFRYHLHSDGEKVAQCRLNLNPAGRSPYRPWLAEHFQTVGWIALKCEH